MDEAKKDRISKAVFLGLLITAPQLHEKYLRALLETEPCEVAKKKMDEVNVTAEEMREVAREYLAVIEETEAEQATKH